MPLTAPVRTFALLLLLVAALAGCVDPNLLRSGPPSPTAGSWTDTSGTADINRARNQNYEPFIARFQRSDTRPSYWIRVKLNPDANPASEPWVLQLRSRAKPVLEVHADPGLLCNGAQSLSAADVAGLQRSIVGWVNVPLCGVQGDVHIRLRSSTEPFLQLALATRTEAEGTTLLDAALLQLLLGILSLALLISVGQVIVKRNLLAGAQLLQLLGFTAYLTAQLSPAQGSLLHDLTLQMAALDLRSWRVLMVLGTLLFMRQWLRVEHGQSRSLRLFDVLALAALLALPLSFTEQHAVAEVLSMLAFVLAAPLAVALAATRSRTSWAGRAVSIGVTGSAWATALAIFQRVDTFSALVTMLALQATTGVITLYRLSQAARLADRLATEERMRADARAQTRSMLLMLAHELRTPLSVICLHTDTDLPTGASQKRAREAVRDMDHLIERCLQIARLDDLGPPPDTARLPLQDLLPGLLQHRRHDGRLQLHCGVDLPAVTSNATVLRMVLGVLVDNALRYGDPLQPVSVDVARSTLGVKEGVEIIVSNTVGPAGKPDAQQVFGMYYRSPEAHHQTGAGLGLYLAARLSHQVGASLALCDTKPDRVSFRLWLPS
jgi:signal transduction histidine kinase